MLSHGIDYSKNCFVNETNIQRSFVSSLQNGFAVAREH